MVQIAGTYQNVKNENFGEYLRALGVPEGQAKDADEHRSKLTVAVDGKKISLDSDSKMGNNSTTLILDQEVQESMRNNVSMKSTAKLNGDTLTVISKWDSGRTGTRVYKFSDTELVVTFSSEDTKIPAGKRFYKRI